MTDTPPPADPKVTELDIYRRKKTEKVYTCKKCGSQLWYLHWSAPGLVGHIECRFCGAVPLQKCWGERDMGEEP